MSLKAELVTWDAALKAYDDEDFELSLDLFSRIADSSKIRTNMGLIYATLGEHAAAVEQFHLATQLDQYLAVAYFQCGVSSFLMGRFESALHDFDEALTHLRSNQTINYEQLGLKFRLYSAEVHFNRGLSRIYLGELENGLCDLQSASKEKVTEEHGVIDEAIADRGEGYTVFSIPVGVLYRPSENKLKNAKTKDYMGKAKLIATDSVQEAYTEFSGIARKARGLIGGSGRGSNATLKNSNPSNANSEPNSDRSNRSSLEDIGSPPAAPKSSTSLGRSRTMNVTVSSSSNNRSAASPKSESGIRSRPAADDIELARPSASARGIARSTGGRERTGGGASVSFSTGTGAGAGRDQDRSRRETTRPILQRSLTTSVRGANGGASVRGVGGRQSNSTSRATSPVLSSPGGRAPTRLFSRRGPERNSPVTSGAGMPPPPPEKGDNVSRFTDIYDDYYKTTSGNSGADNNDPTSPAPSSRSNFSSTSIRSKSPSQMRSRSNTSNSSNISTSMSTSTSKTSPPLSRATSASALVRSPGPASSAAVSSGGNVNGLRGKPTRRPTMATHVPSRAHARGTSTSRTRASYEEQEEEEGYVSGEWERVGDESGAGARATAGPRTEAGMGATGKVQESQLAKIRVKLHYQDDIRGMTLAPSTPWSDFLALVTRKFNKPLLTPSGSPSLGMKFKDEDGGLISLRDEMDFELAVETARELAHGKREGKLEIWVVDV